MDEKHWLDKPENIAKLWLWGICLLIVLVLAEFSYHPHANFIIDGWFAFNAGFGFIACVAMVLFAKLLGAWLKRGEDYYEQD